MLMAQSLFNVLKRQHPEVQIDVFAPIWSEGLLQRMPEIHHTIVHHLEHRQLLWKERKHWGRQLANQGYQQAIVLPNTWKSALVPYWANIPVRTGYTGEFRYGLLNDRRPKNPLVLRRTVDQYVALGYPTDKQRFDSPPLPRLSPGNPEHILAQLHLEKPRQPLLALCPGAEYGVAKRWSPDAFAEVAQAKLDAGWQVWVFGSAKDQAIGDYIVQATNQHPHCINLCGSTQLAQAVDLLALSTAVVSNDSGLMHIAAALNKPLVAIFGSSDPNKTPPLKPDAEIVYLNLSCSPCFKRTCRYQHTNCLNHITPQMVLDRLDKLEHSQRLN